MTRVFADTWFLIAYAHRRDPDHDVADRMWRRFDHGRIITHDGVLTEFLAFFAGSGPAVRLRAAQLVRSLPLQGFEVVAQDRALFLRGLALYEQRPDKGYSLTDCMSMILMREHGVDHVLTNDHHFRQGFHRPQPMKKQRLDVVLVERGLVETRSKAQSLIMARRVLVNGQFVDKAGATVAEDDEVRVAELEHPWVGRGGMKLAHALKEFSINVDGKTCADIGASTGGFTDVMLKNGAVKVYAIDVGYGQLDVSLRNDPRVVNREKVNARWLQPENFDDPIEFVSIDVSFISLKLVLPAVANFLSGELVALIKPQFEVGKHEVGKGGIVRDDAKRQAAVSGVVEFAKEIGLEVKGVIESPVKGAEGNVEFLMYAVTGTPAARPATTPE